MCRSSVRGYPWHLLGRRIKTKRELQELDPVWLGLGGGRGGVGWGFWWRPKMVGKLSFLPPPPPPPAPLQFRDGICKLLRSPGIDSKEWIPPAYEAWRAGTTTLFLLGSYFLAPHRLFLIPALNCAGYSYSIDAIHKGIDSPLLYNKISRCRIPCFRCLQTPPNLPAVFRSEI